MNAAGRDDGFAFLMSERELRTFGACCAIFAALYFYELANFTFYLRHLGLGRFVPADDATRTRLSALAAKLPRWPAEGSVVYAEKNRSDSFP